MRPGFMRWLMLVVSLHHCVAYAGRRKAFNRELRRFLANNVTTSQRSLVVVGAHLFHLDHNDPLAAMVRKIPWGAVLLIEASPLLAGQLSSAIAAKNPFWGVPRERVFVANVGVIPEDMVATGQNGEQTLPFSTLNVTAGSGLPDWATQAGSFHAAHVWSKVREIAEQSGGMWTRKQLQKKLLVTHVPCRTLQAELRHQTELHHLPPPGAVLIDTEALDCRIVEREDFCTAALHPELLVYEYTHCTERARAAARTRLSHCPGFGSPAFQDSENIYFTTTWLNSPKSA